MCDALTVPIGDDSTRNHLGPAEALARLLCVPVELITVQSPGMDGVRSRRELEDVRLELDVPTTPPCVLESNDAACAITDHLRAHPARLLCMATHGRKALGAAMLGSIASDVVRLVHDPLVLVGPQAQPPGGGEIVVAVRSEDPHAVAVVEAAAQLARLVPTLSVHLVSVGDGEALPELAQLCGASFETVSDGAVADQLVQLAMDHKAALLVVGTHVRTGVGRLMPGSVAERVVRGASVPVLIVPRPTAGQRSADSQQRG